METTLALLCCGRSNNNNSWSDPVYATPGWLACVLIHIHCMLLCCEVAEACALPRAHLLTAFSCDNVCCVSVCDSGTHTAGIFAHSHSGCSHTAGGVIPRRRFHSITLTVDVVNVNPPHFMLACRLPSSSADSLSMPPAGCMLFVEHLPSMLVSFFCLPALVLLACLSL